MQHYLSVSVSPPPLRLPPSQPLHRGVVRPTANANKKVPSAENPVLSKIPSFRPGVDPMNWLYVQGLCSEHSFACFARCQEFWPSDVSLIMALHVHLFFRSSSEMKFPAGSFSRGGDVTVHVYELAHSFLFCFCVCFCLYVPFNCISFHKFSRQLSVFLLIFRSYLCLIGPFNYMCLYESLHQPWYNSLCSTGLKTTIN